MNRKQLYIILLTFLVIFLLLVTFVAVVIGKGYGGIFWLLFFLMLPVLIVAFGQAILAGLISLGSSIVVFITFKIQQYSKKKQVQKEPWEGHSSSEKKIV